MHLVYIVRLNFLFRFCIQKHTRNLMFFLTKLIIAILNVCKNLIHIIRVKCVFIKLSLSCMAVILSIYNENCIILLQMNISLHYRQHSSDAIIYRPWNL